MASLKKIKVLFAMNSFGTGGSERLVLDICHGIDRERFEPYVVSLNGGELAREFERIGVWNRCLNKRQGVDSALMLRVIGIIRDLKIDVINAHHFSPFVHVFPGSFLNRCSLIYTDHTVFEIQQISPFWKIIGRMYLKKSYGVLGISHACTRQLLETFHMPSHKSFTVLNAIDLKRFEHRIDRDLKRKELGITADEKVIGVVGNLREQKNHANLLRAFQIICKQGYRMRLLVIGEGFLMQPLKDLSRELGIEDRVSFLGPRLDTAELYQIMDVYCLCSHYEGLPLTILEAMASRIPVVGTDVIGINDLIVSGQNGLLVTPDNPVHLADSLLNILHHEQDSIMLVKNGYRYVQDHHSLGPWLKNYEDIFMGASKHVL